MTIIETLRKIVALASESGLESKKLTFKCSKDTLTQYSKEVEKFTLEKGCYLERATSDDEDFAILDFSNGVVLKENGVTIQFITE